MTTISFFVFFDTNADTTVLDYRGAAAIASKLQALFATHAGIFLAQKLAVPVKSEVNGSIARKKR